MRFTLTTLQVSLDEDVEKNTDKIFGYISRARDNSLVLLPEMFFCGFDYDRLEEFADLTEEVIKELKSISAEKGLLLCGTAPEKTKEGIKNTAYLIQDGEVIGKKSKIKLFPIFDENKHFTAGAENPVFETKFGKVGVLICFEIRFTDLILDLKRKGAEIVLAPAQWGYARRMHLRVLSQARAIELQSYLVVSNTWGELGGTKFAGNSGIYSPWGEVLTFSETGDTLLEAEVDIDYVRKVRESIPVNIK